MSKNYGLIKQIMPLGASKFGERYTVYRILKNMLYTHTHGNWVLGNSSNFLSHFKRDISIFYYFRKTCAQKCEHMVLKFFYEIVPKILSIFPKADNLVPITGLSLHNVPAPK